MRAGAPQALCGEVRTFPSSTTVRSSGRSAHETVLKVPGAHRQRDALTQSSRCLSAAQQWVPEVVRGLLQQ